jgi:dGTPase
VVRELFAALMGDPGLMPSDDQAQIASEGLARTVADYIAGMTDSYIEQVWTKCGGTIRLTMAGSKFKLSSSSFPI